MPESLEARSLSTYLRGSINPRTAGLSSLALMRCVTLDKSTPFSALSLSAQNQRTGSRGSHLLFHLDLVLACPA